MIFSLRQIIHCLSNFEAKKLQCALLSTMYLISMQLPSKSWRLRTYFYFSCWNWKWNLRRKSCRKSFYFIFFNLLIFHDMIKGGGCTSQNNTTCHNLFYLKFYYSYNLSRYAICWVIRTKTKFVKRLVWRFQT